MKERKGGIRVVETHGRLIFIFFIVEIVSFVAGELLKKERTGFSCQNRVGVPVEHVVSE